MKRPVLACALIALTVASQQASAAGKVFNWAGFYAGANVGYGWGNADSTLTIADGPGGNCHFCSATDAGLVQGAGSPSLSPDGFSGGLQFGYNWQATNWVYGLEADFESFSQRQTTNTSVGLPVNTAGAASCFSGGGANISCVGNFSTSVKTDWLITIRPRIGYAWADTLVYVTGGLAISRLSFSQSYSDNLNFLSPAGGSESASAAQTKAGWVLGGGLEQSIGKNWSLKAEYLYVRFDGLNASSTLTDEVPGDFANFSNTMDHFSSNIVRVGFNYKF